jgi:hypothetical protein
LVSSVGFSPYLTKKVPTPLIFPLIDRDIRGSIRWSSGMGRCVIVVCRSIDFDI